MDGPRKITITAPCMAGSQTIRTSTPTGGSTRTTIGALFELILDRPLHKSWRPIRLCASPDCRNPLHYELTVINHTDGTIGENLPLRCFRNHLAQQLAGEVEDDPEDVIDTVLSVDGGRDMTPEALSERFMGGYTPAQFAEALKAIRAQGL
ncbi:hypothetical protein GVN21_13075 [Caulobacter sp. SLTY]|uniref:hypothetical protein n=1 Tax=Caulobacter sp. SLTY TaxID=2683262 RepID=UPI0014135164|nr:hypothetical protein [Caulobacter sp. SLTY]NBB16292.1 hypothetical protein [Caulobacter sp. SLTY]